MKKAIYLILLTALASCIKYDEKYFNEPFNYLESKPNSITSGSLPVINITVNPEEFSSIHDNYLEDKEIEALISFYRDNKLVITDLLAEIKIKGSASAQLPLKSLGIKFDKTQDNIDGNLISPEQVLDKHSLSNIKALRLRNSGNDFPFTMLKQICYLELAVEAGLDIDLNYCEQAIVYVNDEFHGLMNINSEVNSNGISRLYNVKKNTITLAKVNDPGTITLKDGNQADLDILLQNITEKNTSYLLENIDQESLIDYLVFQTFGANMDWPYNNVRFYNIDGGKWRFCLYDLDRLNTLYLHKDRDGFIESIKENTMSSLFKLLLEDKDFNTKYNNRYEELINSGKLSPERFAEILARKAENIEDFMPMQIQKYNQPKTMTEWYFNLEELESNYKVRHTYLTHNLER